MLLLLKVQLRRMLRTTTCGFTEGICSLLLLVLVLTADAGADCCCSLRRRVLVLTAADADC